MAFRLLKDPMDTQAESLPINGQTISVGEVLELDIGATTWTTADAGTEYWQKKAVAIESATSSDDTVKAIMVNDYQLWDVDGDSNSSTTENGDRMTIGSGGLTVANSGSDGDDSSEEACFIQKGPIGIAADARIAGWLIAGNGINPDAS